MSKVGVGNGMSRDMDSDSELTARLDAWLARDWASHERERAIASANGPPGALDLEAALYTRAWAALAPEVEPHLDRLRRKIEVARKLFRHYLPDLSSAAAPAVLSAAAVRRLCALLLKAALVLRDARYLNSALKLLDGILAREDCAFPDELRVLASGVLNELVPLEVGAR